MKWHIRLRLRQKALVEFPHWQNIIQSKAIAASHLQEQVDQVLADFGTSVWVTQEYEPSGQTWNETERASGLDRVYRLILQNDQEIPPGLIKRLSALPSVEEAVVGEIAQVQLPKLNQPAYQMEGGTDWRSRQAIGLDEAHRYSQGHPSIKVAVLDTGVTLSHIELQEALAPGYDFVDVIDGANKFVGDFLGYDDIPDDEVGHGTHVAGIIAAKGVAMPVGVVPECKVMPIRVLGAMQRGSKRVGAGLVDNINTGIKWAIDHGADVINMSLGIQQTGGGLPHQEVVDYAQQKGVTIVAASGNDGKEQLYYPGALPHVIAVGAMDEQDGIPPFSTYGKQVSFIAPGTNIYSSYLNGNYAFSTGTSHAAPFVTGAVALLKSYALKQRNYRLSDSQVKHILKHTADKVDTRFKHHKAGFGRLNLADALRLLNYKLSE
jgi:thermitase